MRVSVRSVRSVSEREGEQGVRSECKDECEE